MIRNFQKLLFLLFILVFISIWINLNTGFVDIPFYDFFNANPFHQEVIRLRINRVLIIFLAGISIPTSGFLLQEYFRNPIAGPSVLGITSIASLCVAFYILLSRNYSFSEFLQGSLMSFSAITGSIILLFSLIILAKKIKDSSYLIIFGFLISSLSGAIISILQFYAENELLKSYILWSFGGNSQVTFTQIIILSFIILMGLFLTFKCIKPLIGISLGTDYAQTMGVNIQSVKILTITASSLLSASITAFLGPVLFVGVITPHFCRMIWNPTQLWHQWILNMILGIIIMEFFSALSENLQLPLNTITSLFGIPVILLILLKNK